MKPYDVGLICGRFQTFHKGHEKLVETGLLLCDRLLILVGSSQECGTERNPLNINTRTKMLKAVYGDDPNIMIYGLPDLTNSKGEHTNAVLGFINIILRVLEDEKPTHFAVAFVSFSFDDLIKFSKVTGSSALAEIKSSSTAFSIIETSISLIVFSPLISKKYY